jgi:hypothetical protein
MAGERPPLSLRSCPILEEGDGLVDEVVDIAVLAGDHVDQGQIIGGNARARAGRPALLRHGGAHGGTR